jgi:hypothetical protein
MLIVLSIQEKKYINIKLNGKNKIIFKRIEKKYFSIDKL